jgi:signal transduction histidine kinase
VFHNTFLSHTLDYALILFALVFASFIVGTDMVVQTVQLESWGANPIFGEGIWVLYGVVLALTMMIVAVIGNAYRRFGGEEKERLRHFLVGTLMVVFFNVIFSIFIPIMRESYEFYQFGSYSIPLFLILLGFLITGQKVIIMRLAVVIFFILAILALLLFDIYVLTTQVYLAYFKILIFMLVIVAGYVLIRNALNEVKKREQIEQITAQIQDTNDKLKEAYKQLEELDQAKTEFIAISSQRLRNPLSVTKGYISMVLEGTYGSLPEKAEKPMGNIYQANERLIHLVNDLLDISKIESGKFEVVIEKINLHDLLKESTEELRPEAEKKGLSLELENGKGVVVEGDSNKLKQVFSNFLSNAIKYTQEGGVKVSVQEKENTVVIAFSDTGEGMEEKELQKLFEIFARGAAGLKLHTEGAGLGLYVAKKITEVHKGRIWAESKGLKQGSTFFVELPYRQSK